MKEQPEILLNFWNLLFIGLSFIGIFYSIRLALVHRQNDRASKVLGIYLLLQSLGLLESCFYWTNYVYRVPEFYGLTSLFALLYGPLLLIYFDSVFGNPKSLTSYAPHFLPFLVMLGLKVPFYLSPFEVRFHHPEQVSLSYIINGHIDYAEIVKVIHLLIYGFFLLRKIRSYPSIGYMRSWGSWILFFFISFILLTILYWVIFVVRGYILLADYIISLSSCGSIILLAWLGDRYEKLKDGGPILESVSHQNNDEALPIHSGLQSSHQDEPVSAGEKIIKYKNSGLPESLANKLAEELDRLMVNEQFYKESDLKLETLVEKLNSTRHFVSQVINQYYNTNFFDFINSYRIDEAKRLLLNGDKEMNIIEIAYAVGYSNKVTFNTVFKRFVGVSPSEYRKTNASHPKDEK